MNLKERFLNQLYGREVDMTPVGCTTTYGVVDFMKKCGSERPEADHDPEKMTQLALAGHEYGGFEWVKAMGWDIIPLSEAFGAELGQVKIDRPYSIKDHPYADSLEGLKYPSDLLQRGRFPVFKEQISLLKEKVGDDMVIFGESDGAFTAAAYLVGTEQFMKWTFKKPDKVQQVLDVTKQGVIDAANFAFDQGVDYYVMAEPTSSPDMMSPKSFNKYVLPLISEIVSKVNGPLVLHICGNTDDIISMMCETGVQGISIEEKANMKKAVETANQYRVKVFGNVSTATTLFNGTPEQCYNEAWAALENGTHFLTPGCGIAPNSPLENIQQLKKARDDYFEQHT